LSDLGETAMLDLIFRTIVIYFTLIIFMRIMGKREIGQLSAIDFVVAIVIAELAAIPLGDLDIPLVQGILPIGILALAQISLSLLCLKSNAFRRLIYGRPNVLIANGKIQQNEMRKSRYNIDDLLTQLRERNVFNIADVEFAVLETSGQLTVSLKSQKRPLSAEDLKIRTDYEGLPLTLIDDGEINYKGLKDADLDLAWLERELKKRNVSSVQAVFYASMDSNGDIYLVERDRVSHTKERELH
ncbi:MAG: YetF domain-containing protein, partial [Peptococcaceae bacterium]